jgi:hypothetical protein
MNRKFYPYAPLPKAVPVEVAPVVPPTPAPMAAPLPAEPGPIADAPGFVARAVKIIKQKVEQTR